MKSNESIRYKLAKKIRKILLINEDNEIKKKKKNTLLINSMNSMELQKIYLINQGPITTQTSYFTNNSDIHLVERVVDNNRKINYFYSDNLGKRDGMLILKKSQYIFIQHILLIV